MLNDEKTEACNNRSCYLDPLILIEPAYLPRSSHLIMDIYSLPIATMTTTLIKIMTGTLIMVITRVLQTKHTFG